MKKCESLSLELSKRSASGYCLIKSKPDYGFTIVELLVVIVVIGILAAITIVSFTGIAQRAKVASLQSDLSSSAQQLKIYYTYTGSYPTSLDGNNCFVPANNNMCSKPSSGNSFTYTPAGGSNPQTFTLDAVNGSTRYRVTESSGPTVATLTCPSGFIVVPGSSTYSTSDFCVMKYEAKNVSGVATSQASGAPWPNITQTAAATAASAACSGCHLITDAEWLTIAQNVLNVSSNWSGNAVGNGYIYSGHNDSSFAGYSAEADSNDANGYYLTGKVAPSNQRRTLTLSNGSVIWDLAGNAWEWTSGTIAGGQQPGYSGESGFSFKEWTDGSFLQYGLPNMSMPSFTGIAGIGSWNSAQGIGYVWSNHGDSSLEAYIRGGSWNDGHAGVLTVSFVVPPTYAGDFLSFRVAK
jgi:prepilin-type N-terminal cleavage/methylation domain-containing protein